MKMNDMSKDLVVVIPKALYSKKVHTKLLNDFLEHGLASVFPTFSSALISIVYVYQPPMLEGGSQKRRFYLQTIIA
ncbi:hypothetical protein Leryth_004104 [Lithospermum erythrorhizon]|nr:hypothetical protein Leryth_004104 [Lithospermum erythrorhizon]